jgi:23S rRNA (uracil1939-C5)-methyltransferase
MARRKKTVEDVTISGIADRGKCVGRDKNGQVYFVDGAVPGDIVDVLVLKKKKGLPFGVVTNIKELSNHRVQPICRHFGVCGGCKWQNLSYEEQVNQKQVIVDDAIRRIAKISDYNKLPIIPSSSTSFYRNKLEFTFSTKRWLTIEEINSEESFEDRSALGFHRPGAFDKIVDIEHCSLLSEFSNEILRFSKSVALEHKMEFFHIREQHGLLRNLIIRKTVAEEYMVLFSFFKRDEENIKILLDAVGDKFPQIDTILFVINSKKNDTINDLEIETYKGSGFITEQLGDVRFRIGPKSFFQTNSIQAKSLYDVVVDFADFQGNENVYDLYTGLGSIALYISKFCQTVVGVEEIEEAVEDAQKNKEINDIVNATFYCGDVKEVVDEQFIDTHGKADVVICDPPRAGMHKDLLNTLLLLEAPKIVYVSCNPSTQARDLLILSEKYKLIKSRAVDMFPHTNHIENVVLLELRKQA